MLPHIGACLALCFVLCSTAVGHKLPKEFKRCKKGSPGENECLRVAIQASMDTLKKGVPSLGLLSTDPLRVTSLPLDQGAGPVRIRLTFKDLDVLGLTSAIIDNVDANWDEYRISYDALLRAPFVMKGQYSVEGQVLVLPIQGAGASNITLENVRARLELTGRPLAKGGQTYLDVDRLKMTFKTDKMHMRFENLFNGDKALGENMNRFLNENWSDILKELQPSIENALGETFRQIANRIFHKVPLNQIYL